MPVVWGQWLVFLGRFLQGLWTGAQQAIEQAYISEAVSKQNNLSMIADLGSAAVLGFVLGPIFGLLATVIDFHIGGLYISHYSACGYLQVIFTIIMLVASLFFFKEIPREYRLNNMNKQEADGVGINIPTSPEEGESKEDFEKRKYAAEQKFNAQQQINKDEERRLQERAEELAQDETLDIKKLSPHDCKIPSS